MKTIFRLPGAEYAYAQVETSEGSVMDNAREIRDMDAAFWQVVGNALSQGCAQVALGTLQPQVIGQEDNEPTWNEAASTPRWAEHPQGYQTAPQGYQAPQNGYQAPQGAYQPQQPTYQAPSATPPGQQAPICQQHGRPADFKDAGVSKKTGRPYSAFWTCAAGSNDCTRASNFPRL